VRRQQERERHDTMEIHHGPPAPLGFAHSPGCAAFRFYSNYVLGSTLTAKVAPRRCALLLLLPLARPIRATSTAAGACAAAPAATLAHADLAPHDAFFNTAYERNTHKKPNTDNMCNMQQALQIGSDCCSCRRRRLRCRSARPRRRSARAALHAAAQHAAALLAQRDDVDVLLNQLEEALLLLPPPPPPPSKPPPPLPPIAPSLHDCRCRRARSSIIGARKDTWLLRAWYARRPRQPWLLRAWHARRPAKPTSSTTRKAIGARAAAAACPPTRARAPHPLGTDIAKGEARSEIVIAKGEARSEIVIAKGEARSEIVIAKGEAPSEIVTAKGVSPERKHKKHSDLYRWW
jgi:hypothetical protein